MGLDMYLHAEKYVSSKKLFDDDDPSKFDLLVENFCEDEAAEAARKVAFPSARVVFTVGYWRKAHAIHEWFVRECQDGVDECQTTHVSREKLKELQEICLRLLASGNNEDLSEELLGGGYGDWFWQDVKDTVTQIDRALRLDGRWALYYRSSW